MKASLKLGKISQVEIKVHWTFLLIFVWIILEEARQGGTWSSVLFNAAFVLLLFACVVLHELGHALTAQRFGIRTRKITLLPIGGVASLEKLPEAPYQELLVALAGPLVNVAIAMFIYILAPVQEQLQLPMLQLLESLNKLTLDNFLLFLFLANGSLALFNMIPAFPMDGGRVLRALLAMYMNRVQATRIAAGIGQFIAVLFLMLGLAYNIFLVFIALFVFVGAYGENKMVQYNALLKGHQVREAMLTNITRLSPDDRLEKVLSLILTGTERDFIVSADGKAVGVLNHSRIMKNAAHADVAVKELMETDFRTIKASAPLQQVFQLLESSKANYFPVVDDRGDVYGAIDMANLNEYILIQSRLEF